MTLDWFKGKRVTVMGLGFHGGGVGVAKWLVSLSASVTVTDLGTEEKLTDSMKELADLPIRWVLGRHEDSDFIDTDLIVRNPAIPSASPYLQLARDYQVPIEMETSLFFRFSPTRNIIAITGTKGKTTTSHLMHHVMLTAGYSVRLAGNMGRSMVGLIDQLQADDWLVLELSSFQCEGFTPHIVEFRQNNLGPAYAVLTNLFEDHLNRYGNMDEYARAKQQLFLAQSAKQMSFFREDETWLSFFKTGLVSQVSLSHEVNEIPYYQHKQNAGLIWSCAKKIGIDDQIIRSAFASFRPPEHRLELVREFQGVAFYNDSTATNPTAAAAGIRELAKQGRQIIAIVGGNDKNMEFKPLIDAITDLQVKYVLLQGTADEKLKLLPASLKVGAFTDYREAISVAYEEARPHGIVTLSPGATSFNLFKDEFDRGNQFKKIVQEL